MEQTSPSQSPQNFRPQKDLPGSDTILVLGIISIVLAGLIGMILALVALSKASEAKRIYEMEPDLYTPGSVSRMKAGRICSIISLCIFGAIILFVILAIVAGNLL